MNVLVTGGAGYIGSHVCVELLEQGHNVTVFDNFSNSSRNVLERISQVAGKRPSLYEGDLRKAQNIGCAILTHKPDAVMHFAGLKAVGESVIKPLDYYETNVSGTVNMLKAMQAFNVNHLVFSSSATVYAPPTTPDDLPLTESSALGPVSPYGRSKLAVEHVLADYAAANPYASIAMLRYFNPIGAHPSGLIGEDPKGIPNNLLPYIAQVAVGKLPHLTLLGHGFDTPDGTGIRDYVHIMGLAEGHLAALDYLTAGFEGCFAMNLGTGQGHSVLEVIAAFERASGKTIPIVEGTPRPGDIAVCYADASKAQELLGWKATCTLADMCADAWRWQSRNPEGYGRRQ